MYAATDGPWTASLASPRKKFVQPFFVRSAFVADEVSESRPAWLKIAPVALVSPENAGPSRPMTLASPMICGATWVAFCGSPSVSNCLICTWQFGFAWLCSSAAICAPLRMLIPSAALAPVSAPAMAMVVVAGQVADPLPLGLTGVPAAATGTSAPLTSICTWALIFSAPPAAAELLPDAAADPLAAGAAALLDVVSEDLLPQAANVTAATATRTRADRIERRCTGHLRRICSPDVRNPVVSTTPTRGEPIPRMAQSAATACARNQNATPGSHAAPR